MKLKNSVWKWSVELLPNYSVEATFYISQRRPSHIFGQKYLRHEQSNWPHWSYVFQKCVSVLLRVLGCLFGLVSLNHDKSSPMSALVDALQQKCPFWGWNELKMAFKVLQKQVMWHNNIVQYAVVTGKGIQQPKHSDLKHTATQIQIIRCTNYQLQKMFTLFLLLKMQPNLSKLSVHFPPDLTWSMLKAKYLFWYFHKIPNLYLNFDPTWKSNENFQKSKLNATIQIPTQYTTFHQHTSFTKYLYFLRYWPIFPSLSQIFHHSKCKFFDLKNPTIQTLYFFPMHHAQPTLNQTSLKDPKLILILTMKQVYTYFWWTLHKGDLFLSPCVGCSKIDLPQTAQSRKSPEKKQLHGACSDLRNPASNRNLVT